MRKPRSPEQENIKSNKNMRAKKFHHHLKPNVWVKLCMVLFVIAILPATVQAQIYVNVNAIGGDDGTSWVDAYHTLQDALAAASSGDQIWVAEGTYYPDKGVGQTDNARSSTFQLKSGVAIYGGFVGNETVLEQRNWEDNLTILSGDIDGDDKLDENSYNVVTGSASDASAVLDGFTITAGNADKPGLTIFDQRGGGMFNLGGSPTLTNVTFTGNSATSRGGGMYNAASSPTLTNVIFTGNSASAGGGIANTNTSSPILMNVIFSANSANVGGGMSNIDSSPTLRNVALTGNSAGRGGGMYSAGSNSFILTNVIFTENSASVQGGGMYNTSQSSPRLMNVTFTGNSAGSQGGAMANVGGNSNRILKNVIIWDNEADGSSTTVSASIFSVGGGGNSKPFISHSLIANSGGSDSWDTEIGFNQGNNIDTNPLFTDPGTGDYTLLPTSPAINMGDLNTDLSLFPGGEDNPVDLAGNPRVFDLAGNGVIDIGVYEFQGEPDTFRPFITTWESDNPGSSGDTEIVIPTTGGGYNYDLLWEDVNDATNTGTETGATGDLTIDFGAPGTYRVEITGVFPRIFFGGSGDKEKILSVEQWGDIEWSSMGAAFAGTVNLEVNASDVPDLSNVTFMAGMFNGSEKVNSDFSEWDVSNIINMSGVFMNATEFNGDISTWQTFNVNTMSQMFQGAPAFNGDIGGWDVSKVENMTQMFFEAESFNRDISEWDVSSVTSMTGMFRNATLFNQDINYNSSSGAWNTGKVESMATMFLFAEQFNQDISGWDVSGVIDMSGMFQRATSFNQNLGGWDISSVTDMASMLNNTSLSLQNYDNTLIGWNGQSVQSNVELGADGLEYCNATDARENLKTDHSWTFTRDSQSAGCEPFRPFITTWKTDNPGDSDDNQIRIPMIGNGYDFTVDWGDGTAEESYSTNPGDGVEHVLEHTYTNEDEYEVKITGHFPRIFFNNGNNGGDNEKILTVEEWGDIEWSNMEGAFWGATKLSVTATDAPDLTLVIDMSWMFARATLLDSDFNHWDVSGIENMAGLFSSASFFNGNISDWNTEKVTDMSQMFQTARAFDQDISGWKTGNVSTMFQMFLNSDDFDKDISLWDVSQVESMNNMFRSTKSFNQDISGWNTGSVRDFRGMFQDAEQFDQNLGSWNLGNVQLSINGMERMLDNSVLSTENYDNTLIGWRDFVAANNGPQDIELGAKGLVYCDGKAARQELITSYNWDITDDTEEARCGELTAEDNAVLANFIDGYKFSGQDFGQTDPAASVKIISLPTQSTLRGNGANVSVNDEFSIVDINSGNLKVTPGEGFHGFNFDSFEFSIVSPNGTESSESYTMTVHAAAGSVRFGSLSAGATEGWRFLTSPSIGDSYNGFLSPLTIQGIPGSVNPGASFPTLYVLDQVNYEWDPVSNMTDATERGSGFIVRVQPEDAGKVVLLTAKNEFEPLDDEFTYSGLFYDLNQGPEGDSHFLVANPHPISLDFCEFTGTNIAASVDFWDPEANGGNGDYINLSCTADDVHIAPFQAFWVRTTDNNPSLSIPEAAYLESMADGFFKENSNTSDVFIVRIDVTSEDDMFTNQANILFSEEGIPGMDRFDAPKLSAAGLAEKWISFYSVGQDQRAYAMQSLPLSLLHDEKVRIPLDIQTTETGRFALDWQLPEAQQLSSAYYLRDNNTGEVMELTDGNSYRFEIDEQDVIQKKQTGQPVSAPLQSSYHSQWSDDSQPRFELLITTDGSDGFAELGDLPEIFTLNQNYPNPFNPTTVISYELPQATNVRLEVYDMAGRQVATLVSGQVAAGRHTVNFDAGRLSSGVYLYRLQAGSQLQTRKLTILK